MYLELQIYNLLPVSNKQMWGKRQREGVVIHRRDSDGPHGAVGKVSRRLQYEDQMAIGALAAGQRWGGRRQGSNQGIAMSSQPAVVEEGGSVDLRWDEWYTKVGMQLEVGDITRGVGKGA